MYQKETVKTDNSREYELTTIVPNPSVWIVGDYPGPDDPDDNKNENAHPTIVIENGGIYTGKIDNIKEEIYLTYPVYSDQPGYETIIDHTEQRYVTTLATVPYINSGFTLTLPAIGEQYLQPIPDLMGGIWNDLIISNPNVKGCFILLLSAYESETITFYHITENWTGCLLYANGSMSITGTHYEFSDDGKLMEEHNWNVHLKKGFNIVYSNGKYNGEDNFRAEFKITTQTPAGAKWYGVKYY
jgi:hypothetical protein